MSIKKSVLEQKFYYRILKICFLILPVVVAIVFYFKGGINISDFSQKAIVDFLQKNIFYIIYAVIGLVLYYVAIPKLFFYLLFGGMEDDTKPSDLVVPVKNPSKLVIIPILIILFAVSLVAFQKMGYLSAGIVTTHTYGSLCTDSKGDKGLYGTDGHCYVCSSGTITTKSQGNCSGGKAGVYCCVSGGNVDNNNGDNGCIATGCWSLWYCSGSYYIGGQEIRVPGLCFPVHPREIYSSWTGTCRKCP